MQEIKKLFANLLVLTITITLCIVALEWGVRIILPAYDPSGHIKFTRSPNGVTLARDRGALRQIKNTGDYNVIVNINEFGFRDKKLVSKAREDDVYVVGDSYSFGWGVEEGARYSDQFEKELKGQKVYNISISTDFNGYLELIHYAEKLGGRAKHLIVGVCMENDLRIYGMQINKHKNEELIRPTQHTTSFNDWILSSKHYLSDKSAAYFLITSFIHQSQVLRGFAVKLGMITPNLDGVPQTVFDQSVVESSANRLKELFEGKDGVVLIIPSRSLWVGRDSQRRIATKIHEEFVAAVRNRGLSVIDPRFDMETGGNPMRYHFVHDGHWTAMGHELAAKMLKRYFEGKVGIVESN